MTRCISVSGASSRYQSGRMDKNTKAAHLPRPTSEYMHRMYTDTVSPHAMGIKFAIDYYGIDHVMYGSDYPCWEPAEALRLVEELELSPADRQKLFVDNVRKVFQLPVMAEA
jgi:aminocarboxymuconate-semialdehyde decarboxylase